MDDLDPATAASLDDLAACLRHVHLLADQPTYRALEQQTARAGGLLPGTRLRRARLTRTTVSDVLLGRKFPGKAFLLTFVDACGVDLEKDRRWEQAWDRLAVRYQQPSGPPEVEKLRQENEELRGQLAEARDRADASLAQARAAAEAREAADRELAELREQHAAAKHQAKTAESRAGQEQAHAQLAKSSLDRAYARLGMAVRRATIAEKLLQWERDLSGSSFVSVTMPLGEDLTEGGTIIRFLKREGDHVGVHEPLLVISVSEGSAELPGPVAGTVRFIASNLVGQTAESHTVLAVIEPAAPKPVSVSVTMPQLGESVTEGTVTRWLKKEGEHVEEDEPLLEVSTDKVDTEIPSPATGILRGIVVDEDETVAVGAQLAVIEGPQPAGQGPSRQPRPAPEIASQQPTGSAVDKAAASADARGRWFAPRSRKEPRLSVITAPYPW